MVIHISLIGRNPEHIWDGLKEIIPAEKLYLLHSPNTFKDNFVEIAKKQKKKFKRISAKLVL